jgi:ATP-dependent Lon protease
LEEKTEIARRYLVPKQLAANGLTDNHASFTEDGIRVAIEGYTREAGVRTLERTVGTLCRKVAVQYANDKNMPCVTVNADMVGSFLGSPRFKKEDERFETEVGTVTGLAWTAVGGTTLIVEAMLMPGKGDLKLTGKLGDVMKESAQAALTYIRANADKYGIPVEKFTQYDLHVHVPEGATPKDGPSAGITMATAILSVFTGRKVRGDVAMTGEITLRGKVLPIGGLKEKSLAARRVGIKTVLIPEGNARDVDELPSVVKDEVTFIPVKQVDEVFAVVLEGGENYVSPIVEKNNSTKKTPKTKVAPLPAVPSKQPNSVHCKS